MDLKGIMLNEISQTEKEKYYTISLTCGIQKTKTELTDTKGRQVTAKVGEGWGEWVKIQKVQLSSYEISCPGGVVDSQVPGDKGAVLYIWMLLRE